MNDEVMKIKYILYARKSTESEDRQVLSIDSQIDELKILAQRTSLKIDEIRKEAFSAKAPGRVVFNSILDDVEAGKTQGIIVWNPDRLSRNSVDTGRIIYLFDLGKLQEIVTPSQVFRNTPNDKFLLNLLCSQAKLENDNKGINVKRGLKAKCERGIYPAPAPTGYTNDKYAERGNKTVLPNLERFDLVRKIFDWMLSGNYTVPQIRIKSRKELGLTMPNGKTIGHNSLYYIFSNPFYYGSFEYPLKSGNWYKGIHKPMITEEEYDRIQVLLGRKGRPRPKSHIFAFTGMMRCGECGSAITAEEKYKYQQNGNTHHYIYYHCTKKRNPNCSQGSIEEKELRKQVSESINTVEVPTQFHKWAMKWFKEGNEKEAGNINLIITNLQKAYKACVNKISKLIDMRASEEITDQEFRDKKSELSKEKLRLEELLADTGDRINKWMKKADEMFHFASMAKVAFENGDLELRKSTLQNFGSNLLLLDKKISITIEKPLLLLKDASKELKRIHRRLEPRRKPVKQMDLERIYAQNRILLRDLDSNQDTQVQNLMSYHWTIPQNLIYFILFLLFYQP